MSSTPSIAEIARALVLPPSDAILVVPPLAHLTWPALGVETLAAVGRRAGFSVYVLYANQLFARQIGVLAYAGLANAPGDWLLGERLFARRAFGREAIESVAFLERVAAHDAEITTRAVRYLDHLSDGAGGPPEAWGARYPRADLLAWRDAAEAWVDALGPVLAARTRVVGVTTSFDQTAAACALLDAVKRADPSVRTVVGGANCDGPMASAVLALGSSIDAVFSGECEERFPAFLRGEVSGPVVLGTPCADLDALPTPDYEGWLAQIGEHVPEIRDGPLWLSYESSRGCWWGRKRPCTFCGLNPNGMAFRARSPERVLSDLTAWAERYPTRHVAMADNIMPHGYHARLVPRLAEAGLDAHVFYEQKANLTLAQVRALFAAGVKVIQPGIESLSTSLLRRMRKGVTVRQNLALLRYARAVGMMVKWNLLHNFPGDTVADYEEQLVLVPLLHHLVPPNALVHLSIDRFSAYFDEPARFGIEEIAPIPAYAEVFPEHVDPAALAYHFTGRWASGVREAPDLLWKLWAEVQRWRAAWEDGNPPLLRVSRAGTHYALIDTRGVGPSCVRLTEAQAIAAVAGGPLGEGAGPWAVRRGYAVERDGRTVPLAIAAPELIEALEGMRTEDRAPVTRLEAK